MLIKEDMIQEELVEILLSRNHNSGFNVHLGGGRIDNTNGFKVEQVSRYISRATISIERIDFDPNDQNLQIHLHNFFL